ncbi:MAG: sigma 54-interacting transcriptional regulator [Pyrinomonadaceae bacterium]
MPPRLVAISGRLTGATFFLAEEEIVIGRETSATVCIADGSVSRRHSRIQKQGDEFVLSDLESLNGTFINGVPVKTRALMHGDRVRVGDSQFLVLLQEGDSPSTSSDIQFHEQALSDETVHLRFDDALYLMARDLTALMKISTTINAIHGLDELQKTLLELLFEVVPARRGAILLSDDGSLEFASSFGLDRLRGTDGPIKVSRTITQKVMREGVALVSNQPAKDSALASESLMTDRPSSVLCAPLVMLERAIGAIYLEATERGVQFDKDHLPLVTAIAGIAAVAIENARHIEWLEGENQRLLSDVNLEHNMVGESPPMQQLYQLISRVAPADSTVLISGESGTGKELAARAIHQNSKRANKAFVAVNCSALPENLLESELFGHEKGAFTGAVAQKKGRLEIADGGTLFLDEVGEISAALQVKLLRVLQEREFERVGGTRTIKVDIRLIAASNKNLGEAIAEGSFRQDLFYRLNVVAVEMPPLRDRREDIPLLASYFVEKYSAKCNRRVRSITPEARAHLVGYEWPGNVRELENAIERAVVLGTTEQVLPEDLPEVIVESGVSEGTPVTKYHDAVAQTKRQIILSAMERANGSYTEAARILEVHPNYLHRLIRNLSLKEALKMQTGTSAKAAPQGGVKEKP